MRKNYIFVVIALVLTINFKLKAQTDSDSEFSACRQYPPQTETVATIPALAPHGTYQFFILGDDSTQLFRTDLAEKIESYRDENTVVHLKVSSTTTISILPCSEITSTRFNPVNNAVVFQPYGRDPSAKR